MGIEYIFGLFISIVIIFVLRELFTWYWKFNAMVSNQAKIIKQLEDLSIIKEKISLMSDMSALKDASDMLMDETLSQEEYNIIKRNILQKQETRM